MTEEDWLRHLEKHRGQKEEALKFADWLEENGKPAHAEIIRLHCNPETCFCSDTNPACLAGGYLPKRFDFSKPPLVENFGSNKRLVVRRFYTPHSDKLNRIVFGAIIHPEAAKHLAAALEEELRNSHD